MQVLDVFQRPGNVDDFNGAKAFILDCIEAVQTLLPGCPLEVRMDSAFFSDEIISLLDTYGVEFMQP